VQFILKKFASFCCIYVHPQRFFSVHIKQRVSPFKYQTQKPFLRGLPKKRKVECKLFMFATAQGCQMVSFSKPKIPICVNFGGGRRWYITCPFGEFSGHLAYVTAIWYIFRRFGTFLPVLVCCTENNLATLQPLTNPADIFFYSELLLFYCEPPG
jgi:hypothetical protein